MPAASAGHREGFRQTGRRVVVMRLMFCALMLSLLANTADAQSPDPIKVGVLNDQSGTYADLAGPGSVIAARLAVEDAGGTVLGRKVEVVVADHQNKPDIGAAIARRWYDVDGVSAIFDVPVSSIALAVQEIARQRTRLRSFRAQAPRTLSGSPAVRRPSSGPSIPSPRPAALHRRSPRKAQNHGTSSPPTMRSGRRWFATLQR
jgi:hypothetical protein